MQALNPRFTDVDGFTQEHGYIAKAYKLYIIKGKTNGCFQTKAGCDADFGAVFLEVGRRGWDFKLKGFGKDIGFISLTLQ